MSFEKFFCLISSLFLVASLDAAPQPGVSWDSRRQELFENELLKAEEYSSVTLSEIYGTVLNQGAYLCYEQEKETYEVKSILVKNFRNHPAITDPVVRNGLLRLMAQKTIGSDDIEEFQDLLRRR